MAEPEKAVNKKVLSIDTVVGDCSAKTGGTNTNNGWETKEIKNILRMNSKSNQENDKHKRTPTAAGDIVTKMRNCYEKRGTKRGWVSGTKKINIFLVSRLSCKQMK